MPTAKVGSRVWELQRDCEAAGFFCEVYAPGRFLFYTEPGDNTTARADFLARSWPEAQGYAQGRIDGAARAAADAAATAARPAAIHG